MFCKILDPYDLLALNWNFAGWSSLAARWAHNPKVTGSNPVPATMCRPRGGALIEGVCVLPSVSEGCSTDLWALMVQPSDILGAAPSLVLWRQGDELLPIACDASSPSLPRLARLSSAVAAVGLVVDPSSWLFVGWLPDGNEVWSSTPSLWIQSPPAHLFSMSQAALSEVAAAGCVLSPSPPSRLGEPASPPQGCTLSMSAWMMALLVSLGFVRDPLRRLSDE